MRPTSPAAMHVEKQRTSQPPTSAWPLRRFPPEVWKGEGTHETVK